MITVLFALLTRAATADTSTTTSSTSTESTTTSTTSTTLPAGATLWTSGYNDCGQLGLGDTTHRHSFTQVGGELTGKTITAAAGGAWHSLALTGDGTLWATGYNYHGELGLGDNTNRTSFTQVGGDLSDRTVIAVAGGFFHSLALAGDGTLWVTGSNSYGQLGLDDTHTMLTSFTQIGGDLTGKTLTAVAGGGEHSLLLAGDGTLWAAGYNYHGELGLGDTTDRHSFTQVGGELAGKTITAIAGGYRFSLALASDGTLWATGYNSDGQLGMGDTTNRTSFTQVGGDLANKTVTAIAVGDYHSLAVASDGTLWAAGNNLFGALGLADTGGRTSFVQVGGSLADKTITAIAGGDYHSLAVASDGTLWATGYNYVGQLGLGDTTDRHSFTRVSGPPSVLHIAARIKHSMLLTGPVATTTTLAPTTTTTIEGQTTTTAAATTTTTVEVTTTTTTTLAEYLIPGRIEAEAYDVLVGAGDTIVTEDVDGVQDMYAMDETTRLSYNVIVPADGLYTFTLRICPKNPDMHSWHVEIDDVDVTGPVSHVLTDPPSWWDYQSIVIPDVALTAGYHVMKVVCEANGVAWYYNTRLNWIQVDVSVDPTTTTTEGEVTTTTTTEEVVTTTTTTTTLPPPPTVLYVRASATGANTGGSWTDAFVLLQSALDAAASGDEIWVAAGTYRPTSDYGLDIGDRGLHFEMKNGVDIYGGFVGTETERSQRDWTANVTTLSGDIGAAGDSSDNCYHVFYHREELALDGTALLDGFTVTKSNASEADDPHVGGGGMSNWGCSPTVTNCTFSDNSSGYGSGMGNFSNSCPTVTNCTFSGNWAKQGGSGMANSESDPTVTDCTFSNNAAVDYAGGMNNYMASPTVTRCTFTGNSAGWGGGMSNHGLSPIVTDCTFSGNSAEYGAGMVNGESSPQIANCAFSSNTSNLHGGGMCNQSNSSPTLANCAFSDNSAGWGGGMHNELSSPNAMNCVFDGNTAGYGGGMANKGASSAITNCAFINNSASDGGGLYNYDSSLTVTNCIFWGNSAWIPAQVSNDTCSPTFRNCDIAGSGGSGAGWDPAIGIDGGGNIDADPLLMNAAAGLCDLMAGSPCIDAADGMAAPATDKDGSARHDVPGMPNVGIGPPWADMGAYEYQGTSFGPIYVKHDAVGANNGTSWTDAYVLLQSALDAAAYGDHIWVAAGTYLPTSDYGLVAGGTNVQDRLKHFEMKNGVGIYGGFAGTETQRSQRDAAANITILSGDIGVTGDAGDNCYHVFYHSAGLSLNATAVLDGFTITGGNGNGEWTHNCGGGMLNETCSPALTDCAFSGNSALDAGGGMVNYTFAAPTVTNCAFSGNSADWGGGGMYNSGCDPTVTSCTFSGNSAECGGGMGNDWSSPSPTITGCAFSGNTANDGGGMYNWQSAPTITDCEFSGNTADSGGGMYNSPSWYSGPPTLANCTFSGNSACDGGGIYCSSSSPNILGNTITGNSTSSGGGAIRCDNSSPTISNNIIADNSAGYYGGGIHCTENSAPTIFNNTITGNSAIYGGGIECSSSAPNVSNNTISGNLADYGAGIDCGSSSPTISNNTISDNGASACGGGIMCFGNSAPTILNNTISGNSAGVYGGGIYFDHSSPNIVNNTIAGNSAANSGGGIDCHYSTSALSLNNIFWANSAANGAQMSLWTSSTLAVTHSEVAGGEAGVYLEPGSTLIWGTGNVDADPLFTDAGSGDYHLLPGSPCIDSADGSVAPELDKDGNARRDDIGMPNVGIGPPWADMGAYEFQGSSVHSIIYVKHDAVGANDGTSWTDAFVLLQSALDAAVSRDQIWVAAGTYCPTSDYGLGTEDPRLLHFEMKNSVGIYGGFAGTETELSQRNWTANVATLSGDIGVSGDSSDNCYHVFYHSTTGLDATAVLDGFTIAGGNADAGDAPNYHGGGMYNYQSSPTITNCAFSGNSALYGGGGMLNYSSSSPTVTNCTFSGNAAHGYGAGGGGMCNNTSSPTVTNCAFSGNSAWCGGGMCNGGSSPSPTVTNCAFSNNTAYNGGGMYNTESAPAITYCTFGGNSADHFGGGMYNYEASPIITNCEFGGNSASEASGGGMYSAHSSPTVTDCAFTGNSADGVMGSGGGMYNNESSPTVTNCAFSGNTAALGGGGGMGNDTSSLIVTNCTFSNNAGSCGGAMGNWFCGTPIITNCAFSGNTADYWGGGLYNYESNPTLTNCAFSGNAASESGGGVYNYDSFPAMMNCILWGNNASTGVEVYNDASIPAFRYCDIQGSGGSGAGWDPAIGANGGGNIDADPLFVSGADYHLTAGSPCIDSADGPAAPATDKDGNARHDDPGMPNVGIGPPWADMGAYEFQGDTPTTTTTTTEEVTTTTTTEEVTTTTGEVTTTTTTLSAGVSVPGRIQAEDYDGNSGGWWQVNMVPPDDTDPGAEVPETDKLGRFGFTDDNLWTSYNVDVTAGGDYAFTVRCTGQYGDANDTYFHIEIDDEDVTGTLTNPQLPTVPEPIRNVWQNVTSGSVALTEGAHVLKLVAEVPPYWNDWNTYLNWIDVFVAGEVTTTTTEEVTTTTTEEVTTTTEEVTTTTTLLSGYGPYTVPARIEAEWFKSDVNGVGYFDGTPGDFGGASIRPDSDVDMMTTYDVDGGVDLSNCTQEPAEWVAYDIDVPVEGAYDITIRLNTLGSNRQVALSVDGTEVSPATSFNSGGDVYGNDIRTGITLTAGLHELRIYGFMGFRAVTRFNWIAIAVGVPLTTTTTEEVTTTTLPAGAVSIPGRIQAEEVDYTVGQWGGTFLAPAPYHDLLDPVPPSVVLQGWNGIGAAGEYAAYNINVTVEDDYVIGVRVQEGFFGEDVDATFRVEIGDTLETTADVTGVLTDPSTPEFLYRTVESGVVHLTAGAKVLKLVPLTGWSWNNCYFNWIDVLPEGGVTTTTEEVTTTTTEEQTTTTTLAPKIIPGKIQAENYDAAPVDNTIRLVEPGVAPEDNQDPGFDVPDTRKVAGFGQTDDNLWLSYNVNVTVGGDYTIYVRCSGEWPEIDTYFHVEIDDVDMTGTVTNVGEDVFADHNYFHTRECGTVALTAGAHVLTLVAEPPPFTGNNVFFNWIDVQPAGVTTTTEEPTTTTEEVTTTTEEVTTTTEEVITTTVPVSGDMIPGRIQAEDFDASETPDIFTGETNDPEDVDGMQIRGLGVWCTWVSYDVYVSATGTYTFSVRGTGDEANPVEYGLMVGDTEVLGDRTIPVGYDVWHTIVSDPVELTEGANTLVLTAVGTWDWEPRINWIDVLVAGEVTTTTTEEVTTTTTEETTTTTSSATTTTTLPDITSTTTTLPAGATLWATGRNFYGELGLGDITERTSFTQVGGDLASKTITAIAGGAWRSLALAGDGTLWATGYNEYGQLGLGDTTDRHSFTQVGGDLAGKTITAIAGGSYHSLALANDGTLWATGRNYYGELGLGDITERTSFTQVGGDLAGKTITAIAAGGYHSLALAGDGTLWVTGWNHYGELGLGDTTERHSFTQVGGTLAGKTIAIAGGGNHSLALASDGTLWATGRNYYGELGLGDITGRYSFTQVGGDLAGKTITATAAGGNHSLALASDGTLWTAGWNGYGELGLGDITQRNSFNQVGGDLAGKPITAIGGGLWHSLALAGDGTLWAAGCNGDGQLGLGDTTNRNSFTNVSGLLPVLRIAAGGHHSLILTGPATTTTEETTTTTSSTTTTTTTTLPDTTSTTTTLPTTTSTTTTTTTTTTTVPTDRYVSVMDVSGWHGTMVTVPIRLNSQGDENALGFSISWDAAKLSYVQAVVGADSGGAMLIVNASKTAQGELGVLVGLPAGETFSTGLREVLKVDLIIDGVVPGGTVIPIAFGDDPVVREVSSAAALSLPANWQSGNVTVLSGYEADVTPRGAPNDSVTTTDWVQVGRFAAGLDTPTTGPDSEFHKADCAPRATFGGGGLTTTDWVQAGRYAAGLDPLTTVGGPVGP